MDGQIFFQEHDDSFSEDEMRTLFWFGDRIPGGFFIYKADDTQELVYINRSALGIFGCRDEAEFRALTGGSFKGLVYKDDFDAIQADIDDQIASDTASSLDHVIYRIVRKDGQIRWLDDYGHLAYMPGYGKVYYVFITDITESRIAQAEKLRAELELAREKQNNELKNSFLFNMSHDIKTPMNAVIGFAELAKRHADDPELLSGYLDKTIGSAAQMLDLVDDMLEMNTLDSGKVMLSEEASDLSEQIAMAAALAGPQAEEKDIQIVQQIDLPPEKVLVDSLRLRRILGNLLNNAVKFTPAGGRVTVRARRGAAAEDGFARYVIEVEDTGIGMSEDFLKKAFDSFEREATSTVTGNTGTGLGLSIVRSLVELMGGSVSAASEKGKGSVFTVELPLKAAFSAGGGQDGSGSGSDSSGKDVLFARAGGDYRVLVVEDIEINRMLAETLLAESGFRVESVADGCDAVQAVKDHPEGYYDLILMDIQMPVMNGYEATRAIRALGRGDTARLPIIALSANSREEDRRMSIESGMNSHVAKPFEVDSLIEAINRHIAEARR